MMKKFAIATTLFAFSPFTMAEWVAGVGYANFSDSSDGLSVRLGALVASAGLQVPMNDKITLVPEVRLGFGVGEDTVTLNYDGITLTTDVELDNFYGLAVRGQIDVNPSFYVYADPSILKYKLSGSAGGIVSSSYTSDWEFGIGIGAGYRVSDTFSADLSLASVDGADLLTLQGRFSL